MKLNNFIKKYDALETNEERDKLLTDHIKRYYVPFLEKNNLAERAVKASCVFDDKYDLHSSLLHMFKSLDLIEAYTDIEFDRIKDGDVVVSKSYDEFAKRDLFSKLESLIGPNETGRFDVIYYNAENDLDRRMTSQYAMNERVAKRLGDLLKEFDANLNRFINSDKLDEVINTIASMKE